jgi:hypothetical protein
MRTAEKGDEEKRKRRRGEKKKETRRKRDEEKTDVNVVDEVVEEKTRQVLSESSNWAPGTEVVQ